jgi:hypothetical protein
MELEKDDYVLGYWFASDSENNCWYMIMVRRGDKWLGQMTFRYDKSGDDTNVWNEKDEKKWYTITHPSTESEDKMIQKNNKVWEFIKIKYNNYSDMFLVQGDSDKFIEIAKTKSYLHWKEEPIVEGKL